MPLWYLILPNQCLSLASSVRDPSMLPRVHYSSICNDRAILWKLCAVTTPHFRTSIRCITNNDSNYKVKELLTAFSNFIYIYFLDIIIMLAKRNLICHYAFSLRDEEFHDGAVCDDRRGMIYNGLFYVSCLIRLSLKHCLPYLSRQSPKLCTPWYIATTPYKHQVFSYLC